MSTKTEVRQFLEMLGHRGDLARVERVPHPTKRLHLVWRASHPKVGAVEAAEEHLAWRALVDLAEEQGPLPDVCEAKTKRGDPCRAAPQRGERFCGAHLASGSTAAPADAPAAPLPGLCEAKTKKGRPCQNAPQKGERFCGPHLEQHRRGGKT